MKQAAFYRVCLYLTKLLDVALVLIRAAFYVGLAALSGFILAAVCFSFV